VGNYRVGNYGLDQSLLRLERELPQLEAEVVVMGVVPETVVRVQSYWKHFDLARRDRGRVSEEASAGSNPCCRSSTSPLDFAKTPIRKVFSIRVGSGRTAVDGATPWSPTRCDRWSPRCCSPGFRSPASRKERAICTRTFLEWLRGPGDFSDSPADDWPAFYTAWSQWSRRCEHVDVLRFEDLKTRTVEVVTTVLSRLGLDIPETEVARAVDASSFARMRAHEDEVAQQDTRPAGGARVVREGKTQGWKEWMTPELAPFFTGPQLRVVAGGYGYGDLPERHD
jgi:hypothetical protein